MTFECLLTYSFSHNSLECLSYYFSDALYIKGCALDGVINVLHQDENINVIFCLDFYCKKTKHTFLTTYSCKQIKEFLELLLLLSTGLGSRGSSGCLVSMAATAAPCSRVWFLFYSQQLIFHHIIQTLCLSFTIDSF